MPTILWVALEPGNSENAIAQVRIEGFSFRYEIGKPLLKR
jgi:hypothetical protein